MRKKMNKNLPVIKQANVMIKGRQRINLYAKRILHFGAKYIDPDSKNPNLVKAPFSDFINFVETKDAKKWRDKKEIVKSAFKNLNKNPLTIEETDKDGNVKFIMINWLQSLSVDTKNDTLTIKYTDEVREFYVYLKEQSYTNTIYEIGQYNSIFTIRIKEFLEGEKFKNKPYFDEVLETLKWRLGVEKKYSRTNDLKRYVLDVAKDELEETKSSVRFTYEMIGRHGRPVKRGAHAVRFYPVFKQADTEQVQTESPQQPTATEVKKAPEETAVKDHSEEYPIVFKKLIEWGVATNLVNNHIDQKGIEIVRGSIEFVESKHNVRSKAGLYIKAFRNGLVTDDRRTKKKQKEVELKKRNLAEEKNREEARINAVKKEGSERIKKICKNLMQENDWLLETAYTQAVQKLKDSNNTILLQSYPKTAEEAINSKLHSFGIYIEIQNIYSSDFDFDFKKWHEERPLEFAFYNDKYFALYESKPENKNKPIAEKKKAIVNRLFQEFNSIYKVKK